MLLNGAPPLSPSPVYEDFFLFHPSWFNENCHRWMKTIWPKVRQKSYWKWAEKIPPPFVKMVASLEIKKKTTTAIRLCLQDIWISEYTVCNNISKTFLPLLRPIRTEIELEARTPHTPPPAPFLSWYDQCLGNCTASYLFLFQFRNDIISMR